MENRMKLAYLINMKNELVATGIEINELLGRINNPIGSTSMIVNRYLLVIAAVDREIERLKRVEELIENWNV